MYTFPLHLSRNQNSVKTPIILTETPQISHQTPKPYPYLKSTHPQNLPPQNAKQTHRHINLPPLQSKINPK